MGDIQANTKVLEDGTEALLAEDAPQGDEKIEYASLTDLETTEAAPAPAPQAAPAAKQPAAPVEEDDVPQEFRGKSKKDVIKMYQDAHKVIGRQGSELGELRQKVDFAIKASLEGLRQRKAEDKPAAQPQQPAEPRDESQFFAKPFESVDKAVENHPVIKEIRETLGRAAAEQATVRAAAATERFNRAHPDAQEIMRDPEFRQWVSASNVRRSLLQRAHQHYDFESGDEIFSTWKVLKGARKPAPEQSAPAQSAPAQSAPAPAAGQPTQADISAAAATLAAARKAKADAAAKAATVPTGNAAGAGKATGGKKIFRRSEVVHLMETDPDRYERLADEIAQAYAEGRVR